MSSVTHDFNLLVSALKQGQVVAIPTETVYGLAAIASNESAVNQIYELKQRPRTHPLILHVHPDFDLTPWVTHISSTARRLMTAHWPGPLTLVFERRTEHVLDCVTGGNQTVAIRCPAHPLTQRLLKTLGEPLVAPSANPFGQISPTTAEHVKDSFPNASLLILDGGRCTLGIESTIVSVITDEFCQVLRPGAIDETRIYQFIGKKRSAKLDIRVPGQLKQHYQPEKPLFAFEKLKHLTEAYVQHEKPSFVLAFHDLALFARSYFFHLPSNPHQVEFELYYQLRLADASNAHHILIELPPDLPAWRAIRDRLLKAAHSN